MGIGIFKKIKNAMKSVGGKLKDLTGKAIKALPKVVSTGKKIINTIKPAIQFIPGVSEVVNTIDKGLDIAGSVGKSLIDKNDYRS